MSRAHLKAGLVVASLDELFRESNRRLRKLGIENGVFSVVMRNWKTASALFDEPTGGFVQQEKTNKGSPARFQHSTNLFDVVFYRLGKHVRKNGN